MESFRRWLNQPRRLSPAMWAALAGFAALTVAAMILAPDGIDWRLTYRPAALAMLNGRNPFDPAVSPTAPFFAAPWSLLILAPLAILPLEVGRALLLSISLVAFVYVSYRLGAKPLTMGLFLSSPPVVHCLLNANIEWIPLLGFVLPPQIGLLLVLVKPQTGGVVALYWLVEAWREGGFRRVVTTFAPLTAVLAVSLALYGLWPLGAGRVVGIAWFNASLFPASIPIGLALLAASLKQRKMTLSMAASPFLSPYVLLHAWSGALASLIGETWVFFAAWVGLWILVVIRAVGIAF